MRIGIDLGGTKIEIAALDADNRICLRKRVATPREGYNQTLTAIIDLVQQAEQELGCQPSVGLATPGAISPATGKIKNANSTCLNGEPLDHDLARLLGREVRIANDADCFTLSESVDGAAAGAASVFGVIIGTGTGGGIAINQQLLRGPNAIVGEWGHNPLPWPNSTELPGQDCYCGNKGCIETWLSGPGFSNDYQRLTGKTLQAKEIAKLADKKDNDALVSLDCYINRMARSLASVINLLDPEVIVLGGGMSNIDCLYEQVPQQWGQYVFSDRIDTRLVKARHGDSSGVRGAAWLWNDLNRV